MNKIEIENAFYELMVTKSESKWRDIVRLGQILFELNNLEYDVVGGGPMDAIELRLLELYPNCRTCGAPVTEVIVGWWDEEDPGSAWTVCPNHGRASY